MESKNISSSILTNDGQKIEFNISPDVEATVSLYREQREELLPVIEEVGITEEVYELIESRSLMISETCRQMYALGTPDEFGLVLYEMIAWRQLIPREENGERRGSTDVYLVCQGEFRGSIPYVPASIVYA